MNYGPEYRFANVAGATEAPARMPGGIDPNWASNRRAAEQILAEAAEADASGVPHKGAPPAKMKPTTGKPGTIRNAMKAGGALTAVLTAKDIYDAVTNPGLSTEDKWKEGLGVGARALSGLAGGTVGGIAGSFVPGPGNIAGGIAGGIGGYQLADALLPTLPSERLARTQGAAVPAPFPGANPHPATQVKSPAPVPAAATNQPPPEIRQAMELHRLSTLPG